MCTRSGEFIGNIKEIWIATPRLSQQSLAKAINISPNTLRTWAQKQETFSELYGQQTHSLICNFAENPPEDIEITSKKKTEIVKVPSRVRMRIKGHFAAYKSGGNSENCVPLSSETTPSPKCESATMHFELLQWRDKGSDTQPIKTDTIGLYEFVDEQEIYDIAEWSCIYILSSSFASSFTNPISSSGTIDNISSPKHSIQPEFCHETHRITGGRSMPITFKFNAGRSIVRYQVTTYNGFQRNNEFITLKVPEFDTAVASITLDLKAVLGEEIEFAEEPRAELVESSQQTGRECSISYDRVSGLWCARVENPEPNSRLKVFWSLKHKRNSSL